MRILFLNPVGTIGGAERVLLDLIASLRAAGAALEMYLVVAEKGPLVEAACRRGATAIVLPLAPVASEAGDSRLGKLTMREIPKQLYRVPRLGWAASEFAVRLRRLVKQLRPDVVHSNGIKCHLLTCLARLPAQQVVWHIHDFVSQRLVASWGLRWAARRATGALAVSHAVGRDLQEFLPRLPVRVVLNAVDTDHFSPGEGDGAHLDKLAGLSPGGPELVRIGLIATYAHWKGQDVFLRSATRLLAEVPDRPLRFYIIGGPIYRTRRSQWPETELRQIGAKLLARGRLGFVGFQEDTAPTYRALDVVVHASTQAEPFGLTIAEGMACGRAVIVASGVSSGELITPDVDAIEVSSGDDMALARAITALVDDPARRQRLGERARVSALARFDRDRLGSQVLEAYRQWGLGIAI